MWNLFKSKNKEIVIVNKYRLIEILSKMVEILRDNGYSPQAEAVKKPLQYLYNNDIENFISYLNTVELWGGSGAAWEVYLEPKQVQYEFMKNIVDLVDELGKTGIKIPKERGVTKAFKQELMKNNTCVTK